MSENLESKSFDDLPYTWKQVNGTIHIFWHGRRAIILRKERAQSFLSKISEADVKEKQLIIAKLTGNFKRGNERKERKLG